MSCRKPLYAIAVAENNSRTEVASILTNLMLQAKEGVALPQTAVLVNVDLRYAVEAVEQTDGMPEGDGSHVDEAGLFSHENGEGCPKSLSR